jgi:hypothetical protein
MENFKTGPGQPPAGDAVVAYVTALARLPAVEDGVAAKCYTAGVDLHIEQLPWSEIAIRW